MAKDNLVKSIWRGAGRLHAWCNRFEAPLILLALLLLLRLPNFAEPYWYGDEGIYLTIGTALRQGLRLYRDIVDHKTPIIYWLAMTPTQVWFRFLLVGWMSAATLFFWDAVRRLVSGRAALIAGFIFVLLTSLPALEGNIPNGELFVIGFISAALWLVIRSWEVKSGNRPWFWLGAGILAGLGMLTKVPSLLDAGAIAGFFWFFALEKRKAAWRSLFLPVTVFGTGVVLTILASVAYFALRGTLADYLQFGLLYNLHYSQTWQLSFANPGLVWLFSLGGKTLILILFFSLFSILAWFKRIPAVFAWSFFWITAAFFAALLSNRPYPHYLLQVVPPLAVSLALFSEPLKWRQRAAALSAWLVLIIVLAVTLKLLAFRTYPLWEYYVRFWRYSNGQIDLREFEGQFNPLVTQNRLLAKSIAQSSAADDRIFIWGTNPMLYALSQRAPAVRFTVAFHIHDLKAYESTMEQVRQVEPIFIVLMKRETSLPGLYEYLEENYWLAETTPDMVLYRRSDGNLLQ